VGSYVKDPQKTDGFQSADGYDAIELLIDGAAQPFFDANGDVRGKDTNKVVAMAREYYASSDHQLSVYVWQLKDAASASSTYAYLAASVQFYKDQTWTDLTLKDASRIAKTGNAGWDVNAHKGAYYIEVKVTPTDDAGRADAIAFATALLSKM
jgi:hypothetical protein